MTWRGFVGTIQYYMQNGPRGRSLEYLYYTFGFLWRVSGGPKINKKKRKTSMNF